MKSLIIAIARELVDKPEQVSVVEVEGEQTLVLELRVAQSDLGKIIGKYGQVVNSIRTILKAVRTEEKKRVVLEVVE
jgi:predicted RNA-binding protein YlqC (UPF0109 family)